MGQVVYYIFLIFVVMKSIPRRIIIIMVSAAMTVSFNACEHLGQNATATWMTVMRRLGLTTSRATLVDLTEYEIVRVGPDTRNVRGIFFSDFVEKDNSNHIRPAVRFRHTSDTLLGDKMMPLSHFRRFYGIEDGRIKAGRLDQFADSTIVLPVRNKDYGYISRIEFGRRPGNHGRIMARNPFRALRDGLPLVSYYPPDTDVILFDTKGEMLYEPTVQNAFNGKVFLADSLGNALFINNLPGYDEYMLEQLNAILKKHPMGPVIIDNGRYSKFSLSRASYQEYIQQDLYRPDSCLFVVGCL